MLLLCAGGIREATGSQGGRQPLTIAPGNQVPLRVIVRPFSHIYREKGSQDIVQENVPVFRVYYVYSRPATEQEEASGSGWYEVGSNRRGAVLGWMRAQDVIEWKQTMSLAYTHSEGRQPVLMFARRDDLRQLVRQPVGPRTAHVQRLYDAIQSARPVAADFPVISIEPRQMVDITKRFYLLPIIDFQAIRVPGAPHQGRLVKLAAATGIGPQSRDISDIRKNPHFRDEATKAATAIDAEALTTLQADIVFVVDTTKSMQPYIDGIRTIIQDGVRRISQKASASLRFGLWGYRDDPALAPNTSYNTRNYTPELQPVEVFEHTLREVHEADTSTKGYPEDVFSGVHDALTKTRWRAGALRLLLLIGDAPGHEPGTPQNLSGQSAQTLRALANDKKTYIMAFYIKNPRYVRYHGRAARQFSRLTRNKGVHKGPTFDDSLSTGELAAFRQHMRDVFEVFVEMVDAAAQQRVPTSKDLATARQAATPPSRVRQLAADMGHAALVEWIGSQTGAQAPRDVTAWAADKDLFDPAIQAMEVRVLLNKRQLDALNTVLSDVIAAGRRGRIGGEDFFSALQAVAATTAREPDRIRHARTFMATGLIPDFLHNLPYHSRIMKMTNERWEAMPIDEQDNFLQELETRNEYYLTIHDTQEGWIQLNPDDDLSEKVFPVPLDMLP